MTGAKMFRLFMVTMEHHWS